MQSTAFKYGILVCDVVNSVTQVSMCPAWSIGSKLSKLSMLVYPANREFCICTEAQEVKNVCVARLPLCLYLLTLNHNVGSNGSLSLCATLSLLRVLVFLRRAHEGEF